MAPYQKCHTIQSRLWDITLAAENWDTAVAIAADLVKAEPKNPTTWILLAYAVGHAGNVEQMETVLFKAQKWHPRDPLILFRLACCASVEAKLRLGNAIDLDESVRRLALGNEDLRPLWDWLIQTP
jgi:Flp pilus assembly protein TadD